MSQNDATLVSKRSNGVKRLTAKVTSKSSDVKGSSAKFSSRSAKASRVSLHRLSYSLCDILEFNEPIFTFLRFAENREKEHTQGLRVGQNDENLKTNENQLLDSLSGFYHLNLTPDFLEKLILPVKEYQKKKKKNITFPSFTKALGLEVVQPSCGLS